MMFPCSLSENGGFPKWMPLLEFSFTAAHPKTAAPIATLRIVPGGYECDESFVVYGIYVQAFLEFEPHICYPSWSDFFCPDSLRDLAQLLSNPSAYESDVGVVGEAIELAFSSTPNGRITLEGNFGIEGWGESYLNKLFEEYPFRSDLRFKFRLSEPSHANTLDDLEKLLSVIDQLELGKVPTLYEV